MAVGDNRSNLVHNNLCTIALKRFPPRPRAQLQTVCTQLLFRAENKPGNNKRDAFQKVNLNLSEEICPRLLRRREESLEILPFVDDILLLL